MLGACHLYYRIYLFIRLSIYLSIYLAYGIYLEFQIIHLEKKSHWRLPVTNALALSFSAFMKQTASDVSEVEHFFQFRG